MNPILKMFLEVNDFLEYDEDPVGTTDWWRTPSRWYGGIAPLDALINGTLSMEDVEADMDFGSRGMV